MCLRYQCWSHAECVVEKKNVREHFLTMVLRFNFHHQQNMENCSEIILELLKITTVIDIHKKYMSWKPNRVLGFGTLLQYFKSHFYSLQQGYISLTLAFIVSIPLGRNTGSNSDADHTNWDFPAFFFYFNWTDVAMIPEQMSLDATFLFFVI